MNIWRSRYLAMLISAYMASGFCGSMQANAAAPSPAERATAKSVVWIDTDPSVMPGGREVDDGFALIQAFHSDELDIRGVSVVFGNAPLKEAWPIAQEIVRRFGPKGLGVFSGAANASQLGEETDASRALAAALAKERMTILALGPVTNVATVLKNHPELAKQVLQIIAVAGRRPNQRFSTGAQGGTPFQDFNFELDAPGFQVLLDAKVPLVLAPWELSSKVWLTQKDIERLATGNEATRWLATPAKDWLKTWRTRFGVDGFNPFDTLAIAYLTSPQWITCEDLPVEIKTRPDDTRPGLGPEGKVAQKPYLLAARNLSSPRKARYCFNPAPDFKEDLMRRLLR